MKKSVILTLLAAATLLAAGPELLVQVEFEAGQTVADVRAQGVAVLEELDRGCLVRVTEDRLDRLSRFAGVTVLDTDAAGFYLYVMPRPGFDRSRLARFGRVLFEDEGGVLLRTSEDRLLELNRLPVELARVGSSELVLAEELDGLPPLPPVSDSLVQALVDAVDSDSILGAIERLVAFYTRYSETDSCRRAVEWMRSRLVEFGCDTTYLDTFRPEYAPNVVGIRHGTVNPQRIYIICGHIDNTSDVPPDQCPGSDDNASGTTAALEAARVFAGVDFENTVVFIGFAGEEQGLFGSEAYARDARARGDSILAVLNFDMISYGQQGIDTFEVYGKRSTPNCAWLVDFYILQADSFADLKVKKVMTNWAPWSDHASFWDQGFVALCGIENDFTPEYHTLGDTVGPLYYRWCGTNNVPMATEAIKAAVATIAKLAGAYDPTGVAEPVAPRPAAIAGVAPSPGAAPLLIRFTRPLGAGAVVEVYDATGRRVRTIAAGAGSSVEWDGRGETGRRLAAGIYLFRVADRGWSQTARAVLAD